MNPTDSDCIITEYATSDNSITINDISTLQSIPFGNFNVVPTDISTAAVYGFFILARSKGKDSTYSASIWKKLIVGCPDGGDISFTDTAVLSMTM